MCIRPLRVVATHREATKPSDREAEFEFGIGDCWVRSFDRFEIGREGEIWVSLK